MKKILVSLACGALIASTATTVVADSHNGNGHDATVHHDFKDAEKWAEQFDSRERRSWQKPQIVMRVVGVEQGDVVADIGAGTGYFTQILSQEVGTRGAVYAVDVEPEMIAYIEKRGDLGPGRIETVLAQPDAPGLPDGEIDVVLVVNTWHHIDGRLQYLERLGKSLGREGRVAIVDWHEGDLPMGPPAGSKLSREAVVEEFQEAGWRLVTESVALPYQYLLVFYPPE